MDEDSINFFLEVVQEVIDSGLAPSMRNISSRLAPKGKQQVIIEALETLVAEGRLIKRTGLVPGPGVDHYYPSAWK